MSILTVASSKGGPGKTTVSMILAGRLAADGAKVAALDADPTRAFLRWATHAYEGVALQAVEAETDEARLAHLIDAKSREADAVLIPALSGEADVTEAENTVRLVEGLARAARRDIPARVLLNRMKRTQLARHAMREIEAAGLPMLTSTLSDLVAYGEMTFSGRVPDQGVAGEEVTRLLAELRALGWIDGLHDVTLARGNADESATENAG